MRTWIPVLALLVIGAASTVGAAGEPVLERFPVLSSLAGGGAKAVAVPSEMKGPLLEEAAVERVLWEEELRGLREYAVVEPGVPGRT